MTLLPLEWLYDRLTLSSEIKIISSYFLIIWRQLNVHFLIAFIANLHLFLEKTKYIVFCKEAFLRFSCTYTTMYVKLKKKYTLSPIISLLTLKWLKATKSIKKSPFFIHSNVTSKGVTHWQTKPLGISNFAISIHLCITISNTCTIWVLKYSLKFAPKICFFNFIFHKQQEKYIFCHILKEDSMTKMVTWSNGGRTTWYRSLRPRRSVWLTSTVTSLYRKLMVWRSVELNPNFLWIPYTGFFLFSKWFVFICFVLYRSQSMALCTDITNRNYRYNSYK